jgi:hypothetical protein
MNIAIGRPPIQHGADRSRARNGSPGRRRGRSPWVLATIAALAFAVMTIDRASAHDKGCDGNPVPAAIKLDCCGAAEEHQLKPEQINRGPNDEYVVSFEGYMFVIPAGKALPSNDSCSHIFFPNMWVNDGAHQGRDPKTPNGYCFLTPLDF